jgi:hypothetical protein
MNENIKNLQKAFDALESLSDTDLDYFEDEEEEAMYAPVQYATRLIMKVIMNLESK